MTEKQNYRSLYLDEATKFVQRLFQPGGEDR